MTILKSGSLSTAVSQFVEEQPDRTATTEQILAQFAGLAKPQQIRSAIQTGVRNRWLNPLVRGSVYARTERPTRYFVSAEVMEYRSGASEYPDYDAATRAWHAAMASCIDRYEDDPRSVNAPRVVGRLSQTQPVRSITGCAAAMCADTR